MALSTRAVAPDVQDVENCNAPELLLMFRSCLTAPQRNKRPEHLLCPQWLSYDLERHLGHTADKVGGNLDDGHPGNCSHEGNDVGQYDCEWKRKNAPIEVRTLNGTVTPRSVLWLYM